MNAIHVQADQEDRPLVWKQTADPAFGPNEVLVDIHATALNRADLMQRSGNYPPPPGAPDILGLEMAGVVADVGANVTGWQKGDRVCALLSGGGYAERVAVPHQMLMRIPDSWSYVQAAAIPEVFLTAYVNLFMEAKIQSGEAALVHGGASGVGTAAIQMLHAAGNPVLVTASTDEKLKRCAELGADVTINYKETDFVEQVKAYMQSATPDKNGVDVILDIVGANYLERNLSLLNLRGRLVLIALLGGALAEVNLGLLMVKRLRVIGSVLRSRSLEEKIEILTRFQDQFWSLLEDGTIKPIVDTVYPIADANAAHAQMAANQNIGKIILQVR